MQATDSAPGTARATEAAESQKRTPPTCRQSILAHLDMDCFFAQVEQQRRPELQGKPVVVGADPHHGHGRGVVCTANYEARKYGIKSAMPISQAWKRCPDAVFLPVDYRHYSAVSRHIFSIAGPFGQTERTGIDEGYVNLSQTGDFTMAEDAGRQIKAAIREKTGLTCSIGIAWNKNLAKLAAGLQKPDGLTLIRPAELQAKVWPLAAEKLIGVGPQTKARLERVGIVTIGDIAHSKPRFLAECMGAWGLHLYAAARAWIGRTGRVLATQIHLARDDVFARHGQLGGFAADAGGVVPPRACRRRERKRFFQDRRRQDPLFQLRNAHTRPKPQDHAGTDPNQGGGQRADAARDGIRTQNPPRRRARKRVGGRDGADKTLGV
ncbi:DNA polymerase IV [Candidatus Micrarchaeota archaeon]|nr:DNA polymerase IV [Candidatus Micrarchaeota archaeon]